MILFRHLITLACIEAASIANAGERSTGSVTCSANQPAAGDLQLLQGTWEGVLVGDMLQKKITVTITGNSLHFHRDRNFWFEATIPLPAGKDPKPLHATLTGRSPSQAVDVGRVIRAFYKFETGTLTLATIADEAEETPPSFEAAGTRYALRKVQVTEGKGLTRDATRDVLPQKNYAQPPKLETDSFTFEKRPKQGVKSEE